MSKILYFPIKAGMKNSCPDCRGREAKRYDTVGVEDVMTPTRSCPTCGRMAYVDPAPAPFHPACCDDCGSEEQLAVATVLLPDGMGQGRIYLCGECVARYDEGGQDPDARTG